MAQYGDSLLRMITIEVVSDLFGKENASGVMNTCGFAVSNVFYEQLVFHYNLDRLSIPISQGSKALGKKGMKKQQGDLLESYLGAIHQEVSRESGEGHQEIKEWLRNVLTLRMIGQFQPKGTSVQRNSKVSETNREMVAFRQSMFKKMENTIVLYTKKPTVTQMDPEFMGFWSEIRHHLDKLLSQMDSSRTVSREHFFILLYYYRVSPQIRFLF